MKVTQLVKYLFAISIASLSKAWPGDDKLTKKECKEKADKGDCEMMPDRIFMRENCPATCREPYRKGIRFYESGHQSFFDLSAKSADGAFIDFDRFEGSVTLVTDEFSLCGFTKEHFQELHRIHKAFRYYMEVILFPTNQNPYKDDLQKCPGINILKESKNSEFLTMETIDVSILCCYFFHLLLPLFSSFNFDTNKSL